MPDDHQVLLCGPPPDVQHVDVVVGHSRITGPHALAIRERTFPEALYVHFVHMDPRSVEWEKDIDDGEDPGVKATKRELVEIALCRRANIVAAVGPLLRRVFATYLHAPPPPKAVHEFVPGLFHCAADASPPPAANCLLFGRVDDYPLKGVDLAAKALQRLVKEDAAEFRASRLVIRGAPIGQGPKLKERIARDAPDVKVDVQHYSSDPNDVLISIQQSSTVLMTSRVEGFGLAALEAISEGVPVLVSIESGLAEALSQRVPESAPDHVVDPKDEIVLANRIRENLRQRDRAYERVRKLRADMRAHFSWDKSAGELLDLITSVSASPVPPGPVVPPNTPSTPGTPSTPAAPPISPAATPAASASSAEAARAASLSAMPSPSAASDAATALSKDPVATLAMSLKACSRRLLAWPRRLLSGEWIERPEQDQLRSILTAAEPRRLWLLGGPGSGKSALLSELANSLGEAGVAILGIKADQMPLEISNVNELSDWLESGQSLTDVITTIARTRRVVVLIDQLDALSDIVDVSTRRLGAVLDLVASIHEADNVSILSSCRPFDFVRDIRFRQLEFDQFNLAPPSTEKIDAILTAHDVNTRALSPRLRELLRVPHWLNLFLRVSQDIGGGGLTSQNALLETLWRQLVEPPQSDGSRADLVARVAAEMDRTEQLWVPAVAFASSGATLDALEHDGLFARDIANVRIGFAHQTFFEFARARAFVGGTSRLVEHVQERDYSLFVRPIVLSTLAYLRDVNRTRYNEELRALLEDPNLRGHLRALIFQFLGQLDDPDIIEQAKILGALDDPRMGRMVIAAIVDKPVWFHALAARLRGLAHESPDLASALLSAAMRFDQEAAIAITREEWLPLSEQHETAGWILVRADHWTADAEALAIELMRRRHISNQLRHLLFSTATRASSQSASKLLRLELDFLLEERLSETVEQAPLPDDATDIDRIMHQIEREPRKTLERVLSEAAAIHGVEDAARRAPSAFIHEIFPWYEPIVDRMSDASNATRHTYRRDYSLETDSTDATQFGGLVAFAIQLQAQQAPVESVQFLCSQFGSELNAIHECIVAGLEAGLPQHATLAVEYLAGDSRRLTTGTRNPGSDPARLLRNLAPHLSEAQLDTLQSTIAAAKVADDGPTEPDPQSRRHAMQLNHEFRLRLKRALDEGKAQPAAPSKPASAGRGDMSLARIVDSHVGVAQMEKMKDRHILELFKELPDKTGFDHPTRSFSGGSVQVSRVFGEAVKKHPERTQRYAKLLTQFSPETNQDPVTHGFEALLESGMKLPAAEKLLHALDKKGFNSSEFRCRASYALEKAAEPGNEISAETCELLESWLVDAVELEPAARQHERDPQSILWGFTGGILPAGNFPILLALTTAFLRRTEPQVERWLDVLLAHLERTESPRVWATLGRNLFNVRHAKKPRGEQFLSLLFKRFPTVRDSDVGATLVAASAYWASPDAVENWARLIRASDWALGKRAFGEIVGLIGTAVSPPEWAEEEIQLTMSPGGDPAEQRGIVVAAVRLWNESDRRPRSTEVLVAATSVPDAAVYREVVRAFDLGELLRADVHTNRLMDKMLEHPQTLGGHSVHFIERLTKYLKESPDRVSKLATAYVEACAEPGAKRTSRLFSEGPALTDLSITLMRLGGTHRLEGIALFERLLESGCYGMNETLNEIDRGKQMPL